MSPRDFIPVLLIVAATLLVYRQCLGHDFLINWDDNNYIRRNPYLAFSFGNIRHLFTNFYEVNYTPLPLVSYMVDHALWGGNPAGYHATNLIIHVLNSVLFYILLVRMTGKRWGAFFAVLLFALHPVQVETVAWVSQRKNLMAMLFFLASILSYHESRNSSRYAVWQYSASALFFLFALLSKPVAVVLPAVLVTYDAWFRQDRSLLQSAARNIPFFFLATAFAWIGYLAHGSEGERISHIGGSAFTTFLNYLPAFPKYLILLIRPLNLNIIYNTPIRTSVDEEFLLSACATLLFLAGWYLVHRRRKDLSFWLSFYVIPLLPVSGIVPQITIMNDRYLYFPLLGMAGFVSFGLTSVPISTDNRRMVKGAAITGATVVIVLLGILSFRRSAVWHDSVTLWSASLATASAGTWYNYDSRFIEKSLAEGYVAQGRNLLQRRDETGACAAFRQALEYDSASFGALSSLSAFYLERGMPRQALPYAERLAENYRGTPAAQLRLAQAVAAIRDLEKHCLPSSNGEQE